tara:strand:- start:8017 stop:8424 length:408 start_codon:yes stop_codon:yes gene_type:complete
MTERIPATSVIANATGIDLMARQSSEFFVIEKQFAILMLPATTNTENLFDAVNTVLVAMGMSEKVPKAVTMMPTHASGMFIKTFNTDRTNHFGAAANGKGIFVEQNTRITLKIVQPSEDALGYETLDVVYCACYF